MSKAQHLPLVEIFYSLRGEAHWAGSPATFVRLATCNLACPNCDTEFNRFTYVHFTEVLRFARNTKCPWIVFTGGEPLIHDKLIAEFQDYALGEGMGFKYHLETNGTKEPAIADWDWITCSPKVGANHINGSVVKPEELSPACLVDANEFKILVGRQFPSPKMMVEWLAAQNSLADLYLQPWKDTEYDQNLKEAIAFCLENPHVTLSLQTHKVINVR